MRRQSDLVGLFNDRNRPKAISADDVYLALLDAIVVQDLPPGTKLGEEQLVEVFNLGRRTISTALDRLCWGGVVTRLANRGAWVARPGPDEARAIFAARRAIERGVLQALADIRPAPDFRPIEAEMAQEHAEREAGNHRAAVRLSGRFHILLAEQSRNAIFADQVRLLVARTSLVVALFERPGSLQSWNHDHDVLLRKMTQAKWSDAIALMHDHLTDLLGHLDLSRSADVHFDLRNVFHRK